jgi:hypothetical protein
MEALKDMRSLTDACREAFVGTPVAPSATQQQVSETLRHRLHATDSAPLQRLCGTKAAPGLSVEDEVRSGNSIDMMCMTAAGGWGARGAADGWSFTLPYQQGTSGCHPAEATASGAAGARPRQRALLGVERVQGLR